MKCTIWPIFVLSLPGDEERRAPLLRKLESMGRAYEVIFGVDGRDGLPDDLEREVDRKACRDNMGRAMSDGELACALSHREIYSQIRARDLPGAIILEDDAILTKEFNDFLTQRLYDRAGLILLYHSHARVSGASIDLLPGTSIRRLALPCYGAVAYSISASVAEAFESENTPISTVADWPRNILAVGAMATVPRLVEHPDFDMGPSHLRYDRNKTRPHLSGLARAIRRWRSANYWQRWIIKRSSDRVS